MQVTTTPLPKSRLQLDFELPPERLARAIDDAVRRLARQTRVPGFRPGKAPRVMLERFLGPGAVLEDAVDKLIDDAFREAALEQHIVPLTNPDVEVVQAEEGQPVTFKAVVTVRPEVKLGDYRSFNFRPEVKPVDETMVEKVIDDLRDQHSTLAPVENRGSQNGDYLVIGFVGTRDGTPFEGGSSERMPLILGEERLIPGFEEHLVGMTKGDEREFDITFPEDYQEETLRGATAHFTVQLRELREKVLPEATDEFAQSVGRFANMEELNAELRQRLQASAVDRARHEFADQIIEYATSNADVDLPDVLIDQEVEVMHDELRGALARQGIAEEAYRQATGKSEADLHADFRPQAEKRVKLLLVLSEVAKAEGVSVPDEAVQAEIDQARIRYADNQQLLRYFESERGRNYIASTLRRSRTVEKLIDEWLADHPEVGPLPHIEDAMASALESPSAEASASIGATDPGSLPESAVSTSTGA